MAVSKCSILLSLGVGFLKKATFIAFPVVLCIVLFLSFLNHRSQSENIANMIKQNEYDLELVSEFMLNHPAAVIILDNWDYAEISLPENIVDSLSVLQNSKLSIDYIYVSSNDLNSVHFVLFGNIVGKDSDGAVVQAIEEVVYSLNGIDDIPSLAIDGPRKREISWPPLFGNWYCGTFYTN